MSDWPTALETLLKLRRNSRPRAWSSVMEALGLDADALLELRWLAAAYLKAQCDTLTWPSIGADPAVDLDPAVLRSGWRTITLADGLSFSQHMAVFRRKKASATDDAPQSGPRLYELTLRTLESLERTRDLLDDFRAHPPAADSPVPTKTGRGRTAPVDAAGSGRIAPQFAAWLAGCDRDLMAALKQSRELLALLTGDRQAAASNRAQPELDLPSMAVLMERLAYAKHLLDELEGFVLEQQPKSET